MHLIVDVIVSVDCFLCNLSEEEKILKPEIDLLNFIVVDVIVSVLILIYSNERTYTNILIFIQLKTK